MFGSFLINTCQEWGSALLYDFAHFVLKMDNHATKLWPAGMLANRGSQTGKSGSFPAFVCEAVTYAGPSTVKQHRKSTSTWIRDPLTYHVQS